MNKIFYVTFLTVLFFSVPPCFAQLEDVNGDEEVRAVAVGDSLTSGVGDGVPAGEFVEEAPIISGTFGYPGRVEGFLGIFVDNRGVPGELATEGLVTRFAATVQGSAADYVFILAGSNDAIFRTDSSVYRATIQKMINIANVLGVIPVLVTLPPTCCDRESLNPFLQAYSREVRELAAVNTLLVADFEVAFQSSCPSTESCFLLNQPEGLHPNTEGYDLMGRVISEAILGEPIVEEGEEESEEESS